MGYKPIPEAKIVEWLRAGNNLEEFLPYKGVKKISKIIDIPERKAATVFVERCRQELFNRPELVGRTTSPVILERLNKAYKNLHNYR